ncbi:hypothetical protein [Fictibacillus arsenicus]|uniref:MucB/RseB N-terminal domain-containing protein n=1 Tax=Fictibacillus arsenicus TaxID=255247 RepID=A0A1V3G836_9BACL|nr:hypothetical protein [Fictibacillus arsenicus]OOE12561.1 hypothetical protein UN64_10815 [Fictibacillus arsenicus]
MEDKLKNLNEKMNSTLLKNLDFNENSMMQVMRKVKESEKPQNSSFFSRTWKFTLSTVVSVFLLTAVTLFAVEQITLTESGDTKRLKENLANKPATTTYVPEKKEEYFGKMTKEEVLTKMINTIDYFETAKGSFEEYTHNNMTTVEYQLNMKKPIGGFSKTVHVPNGKKNSNVEITYYDKSTIWSISKENNSYRKIGYLPTATCCTLKIEDAFSTESDGANMTSYRDRPPIGMAQNSLFPYEIASNYTRDLERWEIEKQNERVLGHNTVVIKGNLDSYASEKHSSETFRFWVDKDTGILVKYETYNKNDEVVNYLYPKELLINIPIEVSKLKPDITKYKNQFDINNESPSGEKKFLAEDNSKVALFVVGDELEVFELEEKGIKNIQSIFNAISLKNAQQKYPFLKLQKEPTYVVFDNKKQIFNTSDYNELVKYLKNLKLK